MTKVPNELSQKILNNIHGKLHPDVVLLLLKFFLVHSLSAVITLAICPQFGINTFKLPFNLMHTFMVFGLPVCNFLCGVFFTATSVIFSAFILKRDEIRFLRFNKILANATLVLSSIGFFSIMNPHVFLELSLLWILGAVIGITFSLEMGGRVLAKN